ncbi:MAG: hypothetical protein GX986_12835 [Firmicutes bacterium]|nr:hypothetical protein [Bacillota bacterium]
MKLSNNRDNRIVGFDIDGVLTDELAGGVNIWQQEVEAYFPGLELLEPSFAFTTAYGLSPAKVDEFMEARANAIFSKVPAQIGCKELLDGLVEMDFTIHLITARDECYKEVTKEWLERHDLPYAGLWFQESKGVLCRSLGIEVFVDDYWENCVDIRNHGVVSLLMSAHHNLTCSADEGIHRVENWQEIDVFTTAHYGLDMDNWLQISGA